MRLVIITIATLLVVGCAPIPTQVEKDEAQTQRDLASVRLRNCLDTAAKKLAKTTSTNWEVVQATVTNCNDKIRRYCELLARRQSLNLSNSSHRAQFDREQPPKCVDTTTDNIERQLLHELARIRG